MIVAGFGFRDAATLESLTDALAQCGGSPDKIAVPADKASEAIVAALAEALGLPVVPIEQADLERQETLTQSEKVREKRGTGSVAEAAALAVAGPGAKLAGPRVVSADRMATCALAETA